MTTRHNNGLQPERTLAEGMRYMLDNEIATDVCFVVGPPDGDTVTFRAHKCVLMSRSEVFEGMFSSGMTECRSGPEAKVRVEDIDPDIFKELLNYMYGESASVSPKSAAYLLYAAKKYMLSKLVGECCSCLLENLDINNVIHCLDQSLHLDEQQLQSACLQLISVNAKAVLTGAKILSASRLVMEAVLEADTIPVKESVMYETAVNWAKRQLQSATPGEDPTDLQIREALGDLLYKIRFPLMKPMEFGEISSESKLLTAEEKASVYYFLVNKKKDSQLKFSTVKRIVDEVWIDRTVEYATGQWLSTLNVDAITFTTDQDVLLTGVGLYTGYYERGYDVDVEILQSTNSMFQKSVKVPFTGDSTPFKILLDEPIVIPAGVIYSVKAFAYNRIGYHGYSCQAVCTKETVTFRFYKHSESRYTTEIHGQIPRLYFCLF